MTAISPFSRLSQNRRSKTRPQPAGPRTMIEGLERRELLSVAPTAAHPPVSHIPAIIQGFLHHHHHHALASVVPLKIASVTNDNGQLVAHGTLGSTTFDAPITLSVAPTAQAAATQAATTTPVLNLMLGPINLNLLGLHVDTSKICLAIGAQSGPGNLLGNLLTGIANLLNTNPTGGLGGILSGLTSTQLNQLLTGVTGLLNGLLGNLTAPAAVTGGGGMTSTGACNILNLKLGPVALNLLGLTVNLDNCAGGPVTVDVTAQQGPGNLLGNLLCGLSGALNPTGNAAGLARIEQVLGRVLSLI